LLFKHIQKKTKDIKEILICELFSFEDLNTKEIISQLMIVVNSLIAVLYFVYSAKYEKKNRISKMRLFSLVLLVLIQKLVIIFY